MPAPLVRCIACIGTSVQSSMQGAAEAACPAPGSEPPLAGLLQLPEDALRMVLLLSGMPCTRQVCKAARDAFDAVNPRSVRFSRYARFAHLFSFSGLWWVDGSCDSPRCARNGARDSHLKPQQ